MGQLNKIMILLAALCLLIAIFIKFTTMRMLLPGPLPINWVKLADTFLFFSIAISILGKSK